MHAVLSPGRAAMARLLSLHATCIHLEIKSCHLHVCIHVVLVRKWDCLCYSFSLRRRTSFPLTSSLYSLCAVQVLLSQLILLRNKSISLTDISILYCITEFPHIDPGIKAPVFFYSGTLAVLV